jgi:hypothetical protein
MCNCRYGAPDCEQGKRLREALALAVRRIYPMYGRSFAGRNAALEKAGKAWADHIARRDVQGQGEK